MHSENCPYWCPGVPTCFSSLGAGCWSHGMAQRISSGCQMMANPCATPGGIWLIPNSWPHLSSAAAEVRILFRALWLPTKCWKLYSTPVICLTCLYRTGWDLKCGNKTENRSSVIGKVTVLVWRALENWKGHLGLKRHSLLAEENNIFHGIK